MIIIFFLSLHLWNFYKENNCKKYSEVGSKASIVENTSDYLKQKVYWKAVECLLKLTRRLEGGSQCHRKHDQDLGWNMVPLPLMVPFGVRDLSTLRVLNRIQAELFKHSSSILYKAWFLLCSLSTPTWRISKLMAFAVYSSKLDSCFHRHSMHSLAFFWNKTKNFPFIFINTVF